MSLFEITPDIQRAAEPITPGWYPMEVKSMADKVEGKDHPLTIFTITIIDGPEKGKFIWHNVNHDPQYMHYNLDWLKFQLGNRKLDKGKVEKVTMTVDNIAHKQFMGYVTNKKDNDGNVRNQLSKFRPMADRAKLLAPAKAAPANA